MKNTTSEQHKKQFLYVENKRLNRSHDISFQSVYECYGQGFQFAELLTLTH